MSDISTVANLIFVYDQQKAKTLTACVVYFISKAHATGLYAVKTTNLSRLQLDTNNLVSTISHFKRIFLLFNYFLFTKFCSIFKKFNFECQVKCERNIYFTHCSERRKALGILRLFLI